MTSHHAMDSIKACQTVNCVLLEEDRQRATFAQWLGLQL